jgi:hypothetical protein
MSSRLSFGTAPGSAPSASDSLTSRVGQAIGTGIIGGTGTNLIGGGGGLTIGSGGTALLTGAPELAVATGLTMAAGAATNGVAIITTPINQKNSTEIKTKPDPVEGSSGGPGTGKRPSEKTKDAIRERDNNQCVFCGITTSRSPGPNQSNIDHADPMSRGGDTTGKNLQNACRACNQQKTNKNSVEFFNWRKLIGQ